MARRKRGHKQNPIRKYLKMAASAAATFLKLGPVLLPAITGVKAGISGGAEAGVREFVFDASGVNIESGQLDQTKFTQVLVRDIALIGTGLFLSWATKRA